MFINQPTQFCTAPWKGSMSNQHPGLFSFARPPTSRPSGTQVQCHHQMRGQSSADQAYTYQGTSRGGHYRGQMLFNPHHGAHPVNDMTIYPPHRGEPHPFPPGHGVRWQPSVLCHLLTSHIKAPRTYKPDISCRSSANSHAAQNLHQRITGWHFQTTQSLSAYARHSNWPAAVPPQQSPPQNVRTPVKVY
jgi:hypothetical protein